MQNQLSHQDPDYVAARKAINGGQHLPYKEYAHQRALYYISVLCPRHLLPELQLALTERISNS
jgi:hypothetical protein